MGWMGKCLGSEEPAGDRPPLHIVDAIGEHTHTAVLLHGRGSTGWEFAEALASMSTSAAGLNLFAHFPGVRWVFPSAHAQMSGWFQAPSLQDPSLRQRLQVPGLRASVRYVQQVIQDEIRALGGAGERLVLGGISQGQAAALHVLLCSGQRLGAFVGASGWLPLADKIQPAKGASKSLRKLLGIANKKKGEDSVAATPVFLGHGTFDAVVSVELGRQACRLLRDMKMDVSWREYQGADLNGHWLKEPEELDDIAEFLKDKLKLNNMNTTREQTCGQ